MPFLRFDHMGVVVRDLEPAVRFFLDLGFQRDGQAEVGGEWVDRVIGVAGTRADVVMVSAPDGSGRLEISTFRAPLTEETPTPLPSNALGLRHIAYEVTDVEEVLAQARAAGYDTVGEAMDYEDIYRVAYIRGPEGLILEVAERLSPASDEAPTAGVERGA